MHYYKHIGYCQIIMANADTINMHNVALTVLMTYQSRITLPTLTFEGSKYPTNIPLK